MAIFFTTGAQPPPRRIGAGGCQTWVSERLDVVDTDRSSLGLDAPGELERSIGHDDLGHDLLGLRGIEHRDGVQNTWRFGRLRATSTSLPSRPSSCTTSGSDRTRRSRRRTSCPPRRPPWPGSRSRGDTLGIDTQAHSLGLRTGGADPTDIGNQILAHIKPPMVRAM
jgi:hypothetical protein